MIKFNIGDLFESKNNIGILIAINNKEHNPYKIQWRHKQWISTYFFNELLSFIKSKHWKHYPIKKEI